MAIARVALDCPVHGLFDYRTTGLKPGIGQLVVVPFGKRRQVGLVLEVTDVSEIADARLRNIERVLPVDALSAEFIELVRFASDYYQCPIGQTAFAALPVALKRVHYKGREPQWVYALTDQGRELTADHFPARAVTMRRVLHGLHAGARLTHEDLVAISPRATRLIASWLENGWVTKAPAVTQPSRAHAQLTGPTAPELTGEQREAVESIAASLGGFSPWLLEGITGSGKTEVYFRLVERNAAAGKQSLLLVPEINLTPQLEERFHLRFPQLRLVSLHSHLAEGERNANWLAAQSGEADVVIGTRLAVFTPLPRLGLVIVDEEQDASFKQQDGLRYSARDLAIYRAQRARVPIVLGSATPSLETYQNALRGRFAHCTLRTRPAAERADIRLIDTRAQSRSQGPGEEALRAIEARRSRGEQSLVFVNRRGFAPALVCGACGWNAGCSRCSARLVWHLGDALLRCHYCGHEEKLPRNCPSCGNQDLKGLGQGTQRIEQFLAGRFPDARILRIDRDSTRRKNAWRTMQGAIRDERVDILVGTQMLAKGHDFPKLTLVVILDADSALFSADFRAGEKLFQQLMQVAGRAGRAGLPGEVLVQTAFPDHPLYQALVRQDFVAYARELLDERKRAKFPPFTHQALLRAESQDEAAMMDFMGYAAGVAAPDRADVTLYDPVPATVAKVAGHHRGHLLVQSSSRVSLQRFLSGWRAALAAKNARRVRWSLDVDPLEL